MSELAEKNSACCRSEEIAAYLDGELKAHAHALFEEHLQACRSCASELREQRHLLCALDFALGADEACLELPQNFAQVVAVKAESDMSGVRRRSEHGRAFRLGLALALMAFALLGASLNSSVLVPIKIVARYSRSVLSLMWNALYDLGAGCTVILRALGRRFIFELHPFGLIAFLLFALALLLLPRLITRYHRLQITEGKVRAL